VLSLDRIGVIRRECRKHLAPHRFALLRGKDLGKNGKTVVNQIHGCQLSRKQIGRWKLQLATIADFQNNCVAEILHLVDAITQFKNSSIVPVGKCI
jgi:hypothetical protein